MTELKEVETELTQEQKIYLQSMFWRYEEELEAKIYEKMAEEFRLLSRYKADLARNYKELNGFHGTLLGCMKEMLDRQDSLISLHNDLLHKLKVQGTLQLVSGDS